MPEHARMGEKSFRGIPVSEGVCRGPILVLGKPTDTVPIRTVTEEELPNELQRLEQALIQTRQQILEVQRKVGEVMGADDASIFDAHLLVLEDRTLLDEVTRVMAQKRISVEQAFGQVAEKYAKTLGAIDDDYLRERAADMRDVAARVLNNLLGRHEPGDLKHLKEPSIIISYDLSPSITAMFDKKKVLGFATDVGSKTSHTAIMARSLQIPAVVGLKNVSQQLEAGQYALLDGYNGYLVLNPTDQTLFEYGQLVRKHVDLREKLRDVRDKPAVTLDGTRITLSANVEQAAIPRPCKPTARKAWAFSDRIPVHQSRNPPDGRRTISSLSPGGGHLKTASGRDPHPGFGRRQIPFALECAGGDESVSGLAGDSLLFAGARHF